MGIPVYFKTLISDYGDNILHKDTYEDINHFYNIIVLSCEIGSYTSNKL